MLDVYLDNPFLKAWKIQFFQLMPLSPDALSGDLPTTTKAAYPTGIRGEAISGLKGGLWLLQQHHLDGLGEFMGSQPRDVEPAEELRPCGAVLIPDCRMVARRQGGLQQPRHFQAREGVDDQPGSVVFGQAETDSGGGEMTESVHAISYRLTKGPLGPSQR